MKKKIIRVDFWDKTVYLSLINIKRKSFLASNRFDAFSENEMEQNKSKLPLTDDICLFQIFP